MKNAIIILFSLFSYSSMSQSIEVFAGVNDNHFYDIGDKGRHYVSNYISSNGYSFGLSIDGVNLDKTKFRFTIRLDNYSGGINVGNGGLGGRSTIVAEVDKSVISLGVYPINFSTFSKLHFNIGFEVTRLLSESYRGTNSGWLLGQSDWSNNIEEQYSRFNSKTVLGFVGRISYDIQINKSIALTPQYLFSYGVTSEFEEVAKKTKSFRSFIGLGIKKNINLQD